MKYDFRKIEAKWRKIWDKKRVYEPDLKKAKRPFYNLMMFPYPSAEGLHIGSVRTFTGVDIYGRFKRMQGNDVFEPMGLDGFGIHSENYALKTGKHPFEHAKESEKNFYRQLAYIGNGFAWKERLETYDPDYYKWTQWIFTEMFRRGLAYRKKQAVNWCPSCKTVLADEQVISGECERCGSKVVKKELEQWFFKITDYAGRLLKNLDGLDWSEPIKIAQRNWIGKSEGAELSFGLKLGKQLVQRPNFLILHGYTGRCDKNFIPWLKKGLELQGFRVQAPQLPNTDLPKESEQVGYVLKKCRLDRDTVVIGHSLGGVVAMKVLQQINRPIAGLVLVAPAIEPRFSTGKERPFWKTFTFDYDYEKIKKLCGFRMVLSDTLEKDKRGAYLRYLSKKLSASLHEAEAKRKHFTGAEEPFVFKSLILPIRVFTTRPDTLFGATYMVLAPEHKLIENLKIQIKNWREVERYVKRAKAKSEEERIAEGKDKTGVELKGIKAINPATKKEIPIWVADYVLSGYGTGAIMAVPAHDERDFEFARKYNLPIEKVVAREFGRKRPDEKFVNGGAGIVFDPKSQKYAVARWKDDGRISLFAGGVNGKESVREGVLREVREESGFHEFKEIEWVDVAYAHFFNRAKQVNRFARVECFLFILKSVKRKPVALEDHENFEVIWLAADEIVSEWEKRNAEEDYSHYLNFIREAVHRAITLGYDRTSDPKKYRALPWSGEGFLENSGKWNGLGSETAKWKITASAGGKRKSQYRLRDWLISRQRYWGPPIPMVFCDACAKQGKGQRREMPGWHAVPAKELPVKLPYVKDFRPKGTGKSPLASVKSFYEAKCPGCRGKARRETDVSDTFLDSAWYFIGYLMSFGNWKLGFGNSQFERIARKWLPVHSYIGGAEHAVLHLLYSRFVVMAMKDAGHLGFEEPFSRFRAHGLITKDGAKMSKSKGNVVNPDEYFAKFGADAMRMYLAFLAPLEQGGDFREEGISGMTRFLDRVWRFGENASLGERGDKEIERALHRTVKKVGEDLENLKFNTAISGLMVLLTAMEKAGPERMSRDQWTAFLKMLAPVAPFITEELYRRLRPDSIHSGKWPDYDPKMLRADSVKIVVQMNGKVRDTLTVGRDASEAEVKQAALKSERVKSILGGSSPKRTIYVPGRLINFVI